MRHRRWIVIGWLAIAVITNVIAGAAGKQYATDFTLPGTQSQHVSDLLSSQFKAQSGDVDTIVFSYSKGRFDAPAVKAAITPLLAKVAKDPKVVSVLSPFTAQGAVQVSKDGHTAFATINYTKRANLLADKTGKPVLNQINAVHVSGLQIAAGGQVIEQAEGFNIGPATFVGVIAAMVILLITFGSLIAAGLPLVTAGFGLITGIALVGIATHVTSMSNVSPELALMIGLGVGVDYALFIVTRFKENYRLNGGDVEEAVVAAMGTAGRAIVFAGTTVVIALLGMFALGVTLLDGAAVAAAVGVVSVLLASLTLLPTLLSFAGRRIGERGAAPDGADADRPGFWLRWVRQVQRRPAVVAVFATGVMLVLAAPNLGLRLASSDASNDPSSQTTHQAYTLLAQGFGPGFNGPLEVAVALPHRGDTAAAERVASAVRQTAGVAGVGSPRLSPSGTAAAIVVYPTTSPQSSQTAALVTTLRGDVLPPVEQLTGAHVYVGGATASQSDFSHVLATKLPLFIGVVVLLAALLLLAVFRSLVIPIQAALMNLLSIGASLGVTQAIFERGWLGSVFGVQAGPIDAFIPVLAFAIVFGLSMDYEVFLVSRVREEWDARRDASAAVAEGLSHTGRVITAAAAVMVAVFGAFAISGNRVLEMFGLVMAVAVLLDAVIIRMLLLPAVLELLGRRTWMLPAWLERALPRLDIEGSATETSRPLPMPAGALEGGM